MHHNIMYYNILCYKLMYYMHVMDIIYYYLMYDNIFVIAQWNSSLSVFPMARVQFPAMAVYSKRFFPG